MPIIINNESSCKDHTCSFTQFPEWLMLRPISAATATYTRRAALNWSCKTEAHVGINCCKSGAEKISISFWLPRFSEIDDPVLASTEWIYSPSCWREERLSLTMCLQPACPVHSSFLFLDVPPNACGGQRDGTGCDTPSACQKGSSFLPWKLHHGLLCTTQPLEAPEQDGAFSCVMQGKAQGDSDPAIRVRVAAAGIEMALIANIQRT